MIAASQSVFRSDSKLGFFVVLLCAQTGWFFDIYIQGSKKIQL